MRLTHVSGLLLAATSSVSAFTSEDLEPRQEVTDADKDALLSVSLGLGLGDCGCDNPEPTATYTTTSTDTACSPTETVTALITVTVDIDLGGHDTATVTEPGSTVTSTYTPPRSTVTVTVPGPEETVTVTVTEDPTTVTVPGPGTTVTQTVTDDGSTVTVPGPITTVPGPTTTLPGSTITRTLTVSGPTSVETIVVTEIITTTVVGTETGPGSTVTVTLTDIETLPPTETTVTVTATTATVSVCPTLTTNPTYTPPTPLPTDYTWGCAPGYLCRPKHLDVMGGCNLEAGLPADTYVCSPDECIEAPPYIEDQFWGPPVVAEETGTYNVSKYYFNLNPEIFGLNYSIFRFPDSEPGTPHYKKTYLPWIEKLLARQDLITQAVISPFCFDDCNNAALEAERIGKSPELCEGGSAFRDLLGGCRRCVNRFGDDDDDDLSFEEGLLPNFQQWLGFCQGEGPGATTTAEPITTPTSTGGEEPTDSTTVSSPTNTATGTSTTSGDSDDSTSITSTSTTETPPPSTTSPSPGDGGTGSGGSGGSGGTTSTPIIGTPTGSSPTSSPSPPLFTGAAAAVLTPVSWGFIPILLALIV